MNVLINELNVKKEIPINSDFAYDYENIKSIGLKRVDHVHFDGKVFFNNLDEIELVGSINARLILEDAVDLSDYIYDIDVKVDEIIENYENTLDINEILWENIVLEVPISVSNKELEKLSGNGWRVSSGDEEEIDPRLQKLVEIIEGGE